MESTYVGHMIVALKVNMVGIVQENQTGADTAEGRRKQRRTLIRL